MKKIIAMLSMAVLMVTAVPFASAVGNNNAKAHSKTTHSMNVGKKHKKAATKKADQSSSTMPKSTSAPVSSKTKK